MVARGCRKGKREVVEYRVPVLQDQKSSGDWSQNNENILNITELYPEKWLRWSILSYVYFTTILKKVFTF